MAYLSQLTANHILLKAPKGSLSISGPQRAFQQRKEFLKAKWNVYVMKITFFAKFAEKENRKEAPCMRETFKWGLKGHVREYEDGFT